MASSGENETKSVMRSRSMELIGTTPKRPRHEGNEVLIYRRRSLGRKPNSHDQISQHVRSKNFINRPRFRGQFSTAHKTLVCIRNLIRERARAHFCKNRKNCSSNFAWPIKYRKHRDRDSINIYCFPHSDHSQSIRMTLIWVGIVSLRYFIYFFFFSFY